LPSEPTFSTPRAFTPAAKDFSTHSHAGRTSPERPIGATHQPRRLSVVPRRLMDVPGRYTGRIICRPGKRKVPEWMCKPGSVLPRFTGRATDIRLGRWLPNASSASYPGVWDGPPLRCRCRPRAPLLALAPGGVCRAAPVTWSAVRSYRTVSPLPAGDPRAVYFLWHFPASHLDWPLASTLPYGARTFLPSPIPAATGVRPIHSDPAVINTRSALRPSGRRITCPADASVAGRGCVKRSGPRAQELQERAEHPAL
jgi:hypothetical protein